MTQQERIRVTHKHLEVIPLAAHNYHVSYKGPEGRVPDFLKKQNLRKGAVLSVRFSGEGPSFINIVSIEQIPDRIIVTKATWKAGRYVSLDRESIAAMGPRLCWTPNVCKTRNPLTWLRWHYNAYKCRKQKLAVDPYLDELIVCTSHKVREAVRAALDIWSPKYLIDCDTPLLELGMTAEQAKWFARDHLIDVIGLRIPKSCKAEYLTINSITDLQMYKSGFTHVRI